MKIVTWIFIGFVAVGLPGQVRAQGADQTSQITLYEKWQATSHTDYVTAYASARAYVSKYPDGPNAKELIIWLRAFEKVAKELGSQSASTRPTAPSDPAASTPPQLGPNAPIATAVAPSPPPDAAEIVFWQTIASSTASADFEEYLRQYPQGRYAGLARNRITALIKPSIAEPSPSTLSPDEQYTSSQEASWTLDQRIEIQRELHALGHFQDEADGAFGLSTRGAIKQFQSFEGTAETGTLSNVERAALLDMAERLAELLNQAPVSPEGISAAAVKGGARRYARAWGFDNGKGEKHDPAEAAYWYALAASDGEAKTLTNLGTFLARGTGATKSDPVGAALLWRAAAARGEATAMYNLGALYERGIGVAVDLVKARIWYERAAAHSHPEARTALKRLES